MPFPTQPVVQLTDANGRDVAQAGTVVTASIAAGNGTLGGTTTAVTSSAGAATFTNLSLAGLVGTRTVTFSSPGLSDGMATVALVAGPAAMLIDNGGNNQTAGAGTAVAIAPSVKVTDADLNPVSNVILAFAVTTGGGSTTFSNVPTASDGVASVGRWTLGSVAGANTLTASVAGLAGSPITFTATGTAVAAKLVIATPPSAAA